MEEQQLMTALAWVWESDDAAFKAMLDELCGTEACENQSVADLPVTEAAAA